MLFKGEVLDFYCPRQWKWVWNVAPRPYKIYSGNSTEIQNCIENSEWPFVPALIFATLKAQSNARYCKPLNSNTVRFKWGALQ